MIYFLESIKARKGTKKIIIKIITDFCNYVGKSPTQLVEESINEQISLYQRKIELNQYLFNYKEYLDSANIDSIKIKDALTTIKSFYRVFGIELSEKYIEIKLDSEEEKRAIQKQVISEFPSVYLELISIIQAAILGYLLIIIYTNLDKLIFLNWILIINVFILIVMVWHEYVMMSSAWRWIPQFKDALIPFAVAIPEFLITTFVVSDFQYWYYGLGIFGLVSLMAYYTNINSAKRFPENDYVLRVSGNYYPNTYIMSIFSGVIFIGIGLILQFVSSNIVIEYFFAIFTAINLLIITYRSHLFWNRLLDYDN
ncbi:MAG TPA: hypothetical protein VK426_01510 [Methanobacterium sp.]|nr:hypothetical protein [Methanobacterium sp.]